MKHEKSYQRVFLHAVCGQGEMLKSTTNLLDTIEEMGQTHRSHRRNAHCEMNTVRVTKDECHPDTINSTNRVIGTRSSFIFSKRIDSPTQYVNEEEVLQTTPCSTKDLHEHMEGWRITFTKELDSFERLNVKTDVLENTSDLRSVEILPGKVVMAKKPIGDGTHLKKGRVVVCGNFQQVQPGEETCANTPV